MKKTSKNTPTRKRRIKRTTNNALEIIDRITGDRPELRTMIADAAINAKIAELLHAAREKAGLTQAELAERVGTKQPVIARLESADYEGHSLTMLQRIAAVLGQTLDVQFRPNK